MSANLNLIQIPIDATVLFDQLETEYQHRMVFLQKQYEACNPDPETNPDAVADQAVMAEIEVLAREATESHNGLMEIRQQLNDLQVKNNILVRTIQVIKENKEADAARMEDMRVRLERVRNSKQTAQRNSHTTAAYEAVNRTAHGKAR